MEWFLERLQHTSPTLDYQDILNHPDDFEKFIDLKIIRYSQQLEAIPCDLCEEDHLIIPFKNINDEIVISCSGSRRAVNPDELKIWTINKDVLIKNVNSKNHVINKKQFQQTKFALNNISSTKKYSDAKEPIKLTTLAIVIRDNCILKGNKKFELNPTDKSLIYFLYYKFIGNRDECFGLDDLVSETTPNEKELSAGYLKNRITIINKGVKELIITGTYKTNIPTLIKHEKERGYHLNPKLFPVTKS